ncbi:MAG TPA: hypothetical protein VD902_06915, partial [Symbiobacteriaceae bacterium]|nr:hypothetical protein [Symbiobacteriaceae bacterium]
RGRALAGVLIGQGMSQAQADATIRQWEALGATLPQEIRDPAMWTARPMAAAPVMAGIPVAGKQASGHTMTGPGVGYTPVSMPSMSSWQV